MGFKFSLIEKYSSEPNSGNLPRFKLCGHLKPKRFITFSQPSLAILQGNGREELESIRLYILARKQYGGRILNASSNRRFQKDRTGGNKERLRLVLCALRS